MPYLSTLDYNKKMDKNESASHTVTSDGIAQPKRTFGAKVKRSCARFWWLYLLVVIIVVLVIVLPMYDT